MNTPASVLYGWVAYTAAGVLAFYIARRDILERRKRQAEERLAHIAANARSMEAGVPTTITTTPTSTITPTTIPTSTIPTTTTTTTPATILAPASKSDHVRSFMTPQVHKSISFQDRLKHMEQNNLLGKPYYGSSTEPPVPLQSVPVPPTNQP